MRIVTGISLILPVVICDQAQGSTKLSKSKQNKKQLKPALVTTNSNVESLTENFEASDAPATKKENAHDDSLLGSISQNPFEAMDRFFDEDFFAMPITRMMDRIDREMEKSLNITDNIFPPVPMLRGSYSDSIILRQSSPAFEIVEDNNQFKLAMDLPGVKPEDCKVVVEQEGKMLHLFGGRKSETEGGYSETRFDQWFQLGKGLDSSQISANLADGVMVVTAPKLDVEKIIPEETLVIDITSNPHQAEFRL